MLSLQKENKKAKAGNENQKESEMLNFTLTRF